MLRCSAKHANMAKLRPMQSSKMVPVREKEREANSEVQSKKRDFTVEGRKDKVTSFSFGD
jgi:hypothetical protein